MEQKPDIREQFNAVKVTVDELHARYATAAQQLGQIKQTIYAAEPYWLAKEREAANDPA